MSHPPRQSVRATSSDKALTVEAGAYRLTLHADRPFATLSDAGGHRWADLFLGSSLHTRGELDDTAHLEPPVLDEAGDALRVSVGAEGHLWRRKRLVFACHPEYLEVYVEVEGQGQLADVHLFGGYYSGGLRWGSGFFQSGARFRTVWNPEPSRAERRVAGAGESAVIDVMGTSLPGKNHWFFTPAPFCYALSREAVASPAWVPGDYLGADQGGTPSYAETLEVAARLNPRVEPPPGPWLTMGLAAQRGEHTFTAYHYDAAEGAFSLRLAYEGQTQVDGAWRSPSVLFHTGAPDPYAGLERYARTLESLGLADLSPREEPAWWREPIYCGWGGQCHLANLGGGKAPEYCRQEHYDGFLETLEREGLVPGVVVLDDKWQRYYGTNEADEEKWPDLRGWVDRRHAAGQKVLLWWKAWDPEGLPPELCVQNSAGKPVAADPSNPEYEALLRAAVRRMLGPDGYDADGIKTDFSARTPSGPGLTRHGREWGAELLHKLLHILRSEAKAVKPEALIMTHTPNPYFASVSDMIRLNDVNGEAPVVAQMVHRAKVARAACPNLVIDTDNWPMPHRAAWREYTEVQADLGVPSLYFVTHFDFSGEPLEAQDYARVREAWAGWRSRVQETRR